MCTLIDNKNNVILVSVKMIPTGRCGICRKYDGIYNIIRWRCFGHPKSVHLGAKTSREKFWQFLPKAYINVCKHLDVSKITYVGLPPKPT